MKIIVDQMPTCGRECAFKDGSAIIGTKAACKLTTNIGFGYRVCDLDNIGSCPYLVTISNFINNNLFKD